MAAEIAEDDVAVLRARLDRMTRLASAQAGLAEAGLGLDAFMQAIVETLADLTGAKGAIVELIDGADLVYRAATDKALIGTRLASANSLSGLCVAKAEVLICDDALTDPRVDREACVRVGVGSMVCAPLTHAAEVLGVLKVFSERKGAFGDDDLDILRVLASMLGAQMSRQLEANQRERLLAEKTEALERGAWEAQQRGRLEQIVRANEARLDNIVAHAHQAIVTMDGKGRITGWNGHAEKIFGWSAVDVFERSIGEVIVPPDQRAARAKALKRFMETGESDMIGRRVEVPALRRDGTVFPIELAISATWTDEGWQFTALMHDISERRAQEELFENAFNHAPIGMALVDLDGRLVKLNENFCDIIGYPADEALALDFQTITHPDDLEADLASLQQLLAGEIPRYQMEKRYIRKDGAVIWVRLSVSLVRGVDRAPRHFIAQIQDQTARRAIENRYRLMAQNATDVIVTSDMRGRSTFVSPACEAVIGYTPEERLGVSPANITHPEDVETLREAFVGLVAGRPAGRVRWRVRHKRTNDWIWVESNPVLLRDEVSGEPIGFLDVIRDVTAQKAQEDALAQAHLDAEAAMRSKAEFLANMSHELRTPLNSIIGFTRLLTESQGLGAEDQRRVELVHGAGQALHAVIDNVLDFSKLEAAALELHEAPFDPAELLRQTVALLEPQGAAKDLRLKTMIDADAPASVIGDVGRVRQVLLNLLSNAVKFTSKGGVTATLTRIGGSDAAPRLRVEIVDTGAGISPDKLDGLFNRFVQAGSSVSAHYGGTGLGLAISRQLITLMGGEIGVDSTVGKGSTFWFELALPAGADQGGAKRAPEIAPLRLDGRRILVVDDVELNRELMLALLSKYGCEVGLAQDGVQAIEALQAGRYDLVLMDCQMPVMDGFTATQAIRASGEAFADVPIVALTASAQPEHLARCEAAGMNDHLTKPLNPGALERLLDMFLRVAPAPVEAEPTDVAGAQARQYLVESMGPNAVRSLLAILLAQLENRFAQADAQTVREDAHALAGSAGMMGFLDLSKTCRDLEVLIDAGDDHRAALDLTRGLVSRTIEVARQWEAELAVVDASARPAAQMLH
ncbi:PAS domain S-box protein [Caulobacter sp. 1776]|uniref:PAS domain S-box protein n=1 Tax=Caulobacter sp. 1776 TaxID=3156420 RepID=UPI003391E86D